MNKKKQTKNMLMDMTIEEQLAKYEEGVRLVRGCAGQIDRVQKRITVIETETEDEL